MAAIAASAGACASASPTSFAARFIIPGTPAVDLSAPPGGGSAGAVPVAPAPPAPPPPAAAMTAVAATLEASAPQLRERLAALAASPTPEAHLDVAATYQFYGVHDRAFDYLNAGLARAPRHAGLHDAVARLWRDWGFADRALRHAWLAVRYAPDSAPAATTLGSVLWALGALDEATTQFARARTLAPDAPWARGNWCAAVLAQGRVRPFSCDTPFPTAAASPRPRP